MMGRFTIEESLQLIENICFAKNSVSVDSDLGSISIEKLSNLLYYWMTKYHKEFVGNSLEKVKRLFKWMELANPSEKNGFLQSLSTCILNSNAVLKYSQQTEVFCDTFRISSKDVGFKVLIEVLSSTKGWCSLRSINKNMKKVAEDYLPPPPQEEFNALFKCRIPVPREAKLVDLPTQVVAHELGVRYLNKLKRVHPNEWVGDRNKENSPTIMGIIEDSNQLSCWVQTLLLDRDANVRRSNWKWMYSLVQDLRKREDYNNLMSIVNGMNTTPVHRTHFAESIYTRKQNETLNDITEFLSSSNNFFALQNAMESSTGSLPYLGIILSNLIMVEDGNAQPYSSSPLLDLEMESLKSKQFLKFQSLARERSTSHSFPVVQHLIDDMITEEKPMETTLFEISLLLVPRR
eukprot:TRINITY_DN4468_c0_g1_i1.p1 TRINITY_DN4468_c0_g1~~TRINITY_DN4468_c0_g1_i1.p1  ORF type:complete len:405 (-),score=81.12 TRINITY_DN4468_c0_g1_i1:124-1338(-)